MDLPVIIKHDEEQVPLTEEQNSAYANFFMQNAQTYLSYGVDLDARRIMLSGDLDDGVAGVLIRAVQKMYQMDQTNPIEVYINSPGGDIYSGLAIIDVLESLTCPVITYAMGKVCSMGFVLFLIGDERISFKRASFMHHQGYAGSQGNPEEMKKDLEEFERIESVCDELVESKTKRKRKWWNKQIEKGDFWFNSETAKQLGVATKIIGE